MPRQSDTRTFRNDQLILRVSETVDPTVWDENRYEAFFDALCGPREYQKVALRTALRYLLGGRYPSLRDLAEESFNSSQDLQDRYGSIEAMERHLLLPDRLYCTLDQATGTGKSFILYGLATVMLAEGAVDRVLTLCPSNTIEAGLLEKFRYLAAIADLRDALPEDAKVPVPQIIRADETIAPGCLCVENYHAVLGHVRSSIRDSLSGKGGTTLVLNDEVHHVASGKRQDQTKWREFLADPAFAFRRIVGVSGTCYTGDDYFADVVSRYSLRQAIQDGVVKDIDYVTEEDIGNDPAERHQIIYENHRKNRSKYRQVKPLTIFVTRDIKACEQGAGEWSEFLAEKEKISEEDAAKKVLVVTSSPKHEPNVAQLPAVDGKASPVEWIMSVSMLSEGWDVKNVFQIVPSEERAFNSKLLIAQVLGRGLRVPDRYAGQRPVVTVFNHDAWSGGIKHLVEEVLEIEKKLTSRVADKDPDYHFDLHQIDYTREPQAQTYAQAKEYDLLKKGYVELPTQVATLDREVEYERATTGERSTRKTSITIKMYTVDEVAAHVFQRLRSIDQETAANEDPQQRTSYATKYNLDWCREMVRRSVQRVGEARDRVSEENRQKILQALGPLQRGAAKCVRYQLRPNRVESLSTRDRPANSVSFNTLRRGDATLFYGPGSRDSFADEELAVFDEVTGPDTEVPGKAVQHITNAFCFKTPLNVVISEYDPERRFVRKLCESENAGKVDAWIKSTDRDFYPIEFSWKKGEHTKRATFNPDFFLKTGKRIFVIEIKDDGQITDPAEENKKKYEFARDHFRRLNEEQQDLLYQFNFLSPRDFDAFFQKLREGALDGYQSHLDVALLS
jgi:type III restriction enzyme